MTIDRHSLGIAIALALLAGCVVTETVSPGGTMTMPLTEGQVPISDIEGPYGAARYGANAVAIRLWPDSLDDGLAEFTVIVTNNTWNKVTISADSIQLVGHDADTSVLGKNRMLARLESGVDPAGPISESPADPVTGVRAAQSTVIVESTTGARQAPLDAGSGFGAATMAAASRGSGQRPALNAGENRLDDETRMAIEAWYLDSLEIYPGDTGTGGFSVPVPADDTDFELRVMISGESYRYPVQYRRNP